VNVAARAATVTPKFSHISPGLKYLHSASNLRLSLLLIQTSPN
jgi:hypothetical protein